MNTKEREAYLASVSALLSGLPIPYVIIGSVGLLVQRPDVLDTLPPDVDLVVRPQDLTALVRWAKKRGAKVSSWEDEITDPKDLMEIDPRGRFYLRLDLDGTRVDATYELPDHVDLHALLDQAEDLGGLSMARIEDVAALMRARGSAQDHQRLKRLARAAART